MNYEKLLLQQAEQDERIVVMTAENRALIRNVHCILKERFIDTGITEQTMVGMAAGLSLRGRIPVIHALTTFLTMRAFEFIRSDVGIANLPVKLSGFIPGFLSDGNGPTHQAIEDVSLMRGIPNMEVFCPADENDLLIMLPKIWATSAPSYVRINHLPGKYVHDKNFEIGKAEVICEGSDITFLVYGYLFEQTMEAGTILKEKGYSVGLINMRSLKPVDEEAIIRAAVKSNICVTVEDHLITGGLYSIVAETLLKNKITVDVIPLALRNRWFKPALLQDVLEYEEFTAEAIVNHVLRELKIRLNTINI